MVGSLVFIFADVISELFSSACTGTTAVAVVLVLTVTHSGGGCGDPTSVSTGGETSSVETDGKLSSVCTGTDTTVVVLVLVLAVLACTRLLVLYYQECTPTTQLVFNYNRFSLIKNFEIKPNL